MAILEANKIESSQGFAKEIDQAGLTMVLDNLQVNQYQYPVKSTIREIVSNGVDAVLEKQIAIKILSGQAKEEDFYIRREEEIYQSSNFDPTYFDLRWLDKNKNTVEIIYEEGDQVNKKDRIRIVDHGVGLGGKRLEGYFKLSWSSKRNTKAALGKFGIGAKAPLSTGVDSYRMISRYNGKRFVFDIYSHKVDSAVPKFDMKTGKINGHIVMYAGTDNEYIAYYEDTTETNGTEIIIETKKHHRQQYTEGVKSQLLYFDNVNYTVISETGYSQQVPIKARILYEDEHIVLSDNNQFSKPHLVIGKDSAKVNYGYIDFLELELENKVGNIGIKVQSEEVSINPSRESVIWNEKTRQTVVDRFNTVVDIASTMVSKELNEQDFLAWVDKCARVMNNTDSNSVLGRLSRIVDKSSISPKYPKDQTIKYITPETMFKGMDVRRVVSNYNYKKGKDEIQREEVRTWGDFTPERVYITYGQASHLKDTYLYKTIGKPFTLITIKDYGDAEVAKDAVKTGADKLKELRERTIKYLSSSAYAKDYDTVVVPDDWKKKLEAEEAGEQPVEAVKTPTPAELRALEERTVGVTLQLEEYRSDKKLFGWTKIEPKIKEVLAWEGKVVYGFAEDEELLHLAGALLKKQVEVEQKGSYYISTGPDAVKIVRVAKQNKKHFAGHTHVKDFFAEFTNGTIAMDSRLVRWHTARRISEALPKLAFLKNFESFNPTVAHTYRELVQYVNKNYVDLKYYSGNNYFGIDQKTYDELIAHADKVADLQVYIEMHKGKLPEDQLQKEVADKAKLLFENDKVTGAIGIDMPMYRALQEILEYAEPLMNILNYVTPLVTEKANIPYELEVEVKEIMGHKGVN